MLSHLPESFTITHSHVSSGKQVKGPSVNHRAQRSHCTLQSFCSHRVSVGEIFKSESMCMFALHPVSVIRLLVSVCVCTLLYLSVCVDKKIITCCWSAGFSRTPLFGKQTISVTACFLNFSDWSKVQTMLFFFWLEKAFNHL